MKIGIITPFFYGESYLEKYFKMIDSNANSLKEVYEDIELLIILVNDSPKINLKGMVEGFINKKDYSIQITENNKNEGIHYSRISGLNIAKAKGADFIMFLDQDDELDSSALKTFVSTLKKEEYADVLISNASLEQKDWKGSLVRSKYQENLIWDLKTYINIGTQIISPGQCLININSIPNEWCNPVIERNGSDDYYLWLLMIGNNKKHIYIDKELYIHKFTDDNYSSDTKKTDESIYEFIPYLKASKCISQKDCDTLLRMIKYKAKFRSGNIIKKALLSLMNIDLFIYNYDYKKRTKTPLGFNR